MDYPLPTLSDTIAIKKDEEGERVQQLFQEFLKTFKKDGECVYKKLVDELARPERNTLSVDFPDVETFSEPLTNAIVENFYRFYPYLCRALTNFARDQNVAIIKKQLYISFGGVSLRNKLRELVADKIGKLLRVTGQVVRTHPVHPELFSGVFVCNDCNTIVPNVEQQFKYTQPSKCLNPACQNRRNFTLDIRKSTFVDFQKVCIQEVQAELPRGSIPRSLEIILRGECVEMPQPGDRCDFTGTLIVIPDVAQLAMPGAKIESSARHKGKEGYNTEGLMGLKSLGVRDLNYRTAFLACSVRPSNPRFGDKYWTEEEMSPEWAKEHMTPDELQKIAEMSQDPNLYNNLTTSLFSTIHGNEDIKKGILLMLFGGVAKETNEGAKLRGDVNICIVGDPSTAKSHFLKQVEKFSPRAIYTSGKASSAAGLTAAVVKDEESFEFVIEAGALMLADNGVCCIDEFDKMDPRDQVAIHEAMEQQTISITKSGVKIVDYAIARRILDLHKDGDVATHKVYSSDDVQRYILFAKLWNPKLTEAAVECLVTFYKQLRLRETGGSALSSRRVTVRQLESLIRLSEAVARMYCLADITETHVKEAFRLLCKSIIRVEQPDVEFDQQRLDDAVANGHANRLADDVEKAENGDEQQVMIGKTALPQKLKLTFEEYRKLANLLVFHIRQQEELNDDTGIRRSELISWYISEIQDELATEADLVYRKTLVEKVIDRLIKPDNILIQLTQTSSEEMGGFVEESDPIMVVHPNYVLEDL